MSDSVGGQAITAGILMYASGLAAYRLRRRMLDTPTATVASAAIGRIELHGVAQSDAPSPSAVSGRQCAYWIAEILQKDPEDGRYVCFARERSAATRFVLEDASGRVPVLIDGASWKLGGEETLPGAKPLPDAAHAFLARHGRTWSDDLKLAESRLEPGGEVYVLGTLAEARDAARGSLSRRVVPFFEAMLPRSWQARRAAHAATQTMRSLGHDGSPSVQHALHRVWFSEASLQSIASDALLPSGMNPHCVVVCRGERSAPFVIANAAQAQVADGLARAARWGMAAGAVLIVIGVADLVFG